jgi:hypothetical protein
MVVSFCGGDLDACVDAHLAIDLHGLVSHAKSQQRQDDEQQCVLKRLVGLNDVLMNWRDFDRAPGAQAASPSTMADVEKTS